MLAWHVKRVRPATPTKSGLMLGLGETIGEVLDVMRDLRASHVDILTLGQYLRPSPKHLPILRYVTMDEFAELKRKGYEMGFRHVESGPAGAGAPITRLTRGGDDAVVTDDSSDSGQACRLASGANLAKPRICQL